jgi:hypothetical protein
MTELLLVAAFLGVLQLVWFGDHFIEEVVKQDDFQRWEAEW